VGLTDRLERSAAEFMCDSCTCLTPYVTKEKYDSVVSNSIKGAYYLNNSNKVKVALKDIRTIAKEYAE
jgi:predicted aconitase